MLAIEIYQDDTLVYSHDYFANGASHDYYQEVIKTQAWDDMTNCADWEQYDGCDLDEDGDVVSQDCAKTTMQTLRYSPVDGWSYLGSDTMSNDFIKPTLTACPLTW